ncbi:MAG: M23 family metallopeptidase [Balneolaceae bacterium]|jgi:murein DD-endopeptidase MepM/ murein hydrolase activator NlpD
MRYLLIILIYLNAWQLVDAQSIFIRREHKEGAYILSAINNMHCPTTIIARADTMDMRFKKYLPEHSERMLVNLPDSSVKATTDLDRVFEYSLILGNPKAVHDDSYQYSLPFPVGESHKLIQGNNGNFTHNEPRSRYAFDFDMPEGNLITAARGGVVVFVEQRFTEGGRDKKFLDHGNQIAICQDDGTIAAYAHIKHNGAIVKVGDRIFAGQTIAFSGNTGYTTGPHLHFVVMIGNNSIPIHFRGIPDPLKEGRVYTNTGIFQ